ncbi:MAG TPA: ATP-dependent zinc metalloprotease FtsH [Frankiaceae bacterium]|nr:ATP-dependent zinc metalloprotease FtsH [Frankiaceae bacterium]
MKSKSGGMGLRVLLISLLILSLIFVFMVNITFKSPSSGTKLSLDNVYRMAANGQIVRARLLDQDAVVEGTYCPEGVAQGGNCRGGKAATFHATYPRSDVSTQQLIDRIGARAPVAVDHQTGKEVSRLVLTFVLPLIILANLFGLILLSKGGDASLGEIAGFGRVGKDRQRKKATVTGVSFNDVAGAGEAVAELSEVLDYLKDPTKFEAYGATAPKGVILFGPPGCGKTLLARAVAGEAGVPFISVSGTEFVESLVGVGAARVRDLFSQVRALSPAICFIDEIDAVGRRREGEGVSGGEREQTLNQLLVELDGFEVTAGIVVMGATNRPDILDPALMRPGRFDRHITIDRPELEGRIHILKIHARGKPIGPDVDLEFVASRTPGFTGADLANVVNEATLLTIREYRTEVTAADFEEAIFRVVNGPKRRGRVLSVEERQRTAFHEAGHVIVAAAAGRADEVHRVSILARGRAVASVQMGADAEATLLSRTQLRGKLVTQMGGIAAENLIFGEGSTGGEQDIEQATDLARDMVTRYGMSPELGPVRYLAHAAEGFLGNDIPLGEISIETQTAIDKEIRRLVAEAQAEATAMLSRHRKTLDALASRLDEEETLEGETLQKVIAPIEAEMATERIGATGKVASRANGTRTRRKTPVG